jgi:hypothetical protein
MYQLLRRRSLPSAERGRAGDLALIMDELRVSWLVARQGYEEHGRGAIVVDTTQRPTGERHPLGYFTLAVVEQTGDEDTQRVVREYDPSWEMVALLLKTRHRISARGAGVLPRRPGSDTVLTT